MMPLFSHINIQFWKKEKKVKRGNLTRQSELLADANSWPPIKWYVLPAKHEY
jgi:hypothetical protein